MSFDQEYTIYFLKESVTAYSLQEINLCIPSGNS